MSVQGRSSSTSHDVGLVKGRRGERKGEEREEGWFTEIFRNGYRFNSVHDLME